MTKSAAPKNSCDCASCRSACEHKPGWFRPDQIEPLAARMDLTVKQLFDRHLAVDWWCGDSITDGEDVFVLSPAITGEAIGDMFPGNPQGTCVLFKKGKCTIHKLGKPDECAFARCDEKRTAMTANRHKIVHAWNTPENQKMIRDLLGREPTTETFYGGSIFNMLGLR